MGHGACSNFENDVAQGISQCGGSPLIKAMRRGNCDPTSVRSTVCPKPDQSRFGSKVGGAVQSLLDWRLGNCWIRE
jgi:hypothetical protein